MTDCDRTDFVEQYNHSSVLSVPTNGEGGCRSPTRHARPLLGMCAHAHTDEPSVDPRLNCSRQRCCRQRLYA